MKMKLKTKIALDVGMTLLFLLQMAYHLIGDSLHGWLGMSLFVLLILHNIGDWKWYAGLRKGKYTAGRVFHTIINILLLLVCLGMMLSAAMLSSTASALLHLNAVMLGRKLHMVFTSWGFVLMSAHVGLHWSMVVGAAKKRVKNPQRWLLIASRLAALLLSVYGLYTFIVRGMTQRMFLQINYMFFNYEESLFAVLFDYVSILCLFTCLAHYIAKVIRVDIEKRKK